MAPRGKLQESGLRVGEFVDGVVVEVSAKVVRSSDFRDESLGSSRV